MNGLHVIASIAERLALWMHGAAHRTIMLSAMTLLAVACVQPTTQTPHITEAERQEELEKQKASLKAIGASKDDFAEKEYSKAELDQKQRRLDSLIAKMRPEALKMCKALMGEQGDCEVSIQLSTDAKGINAFADGERVVVSPAIMEFTQAHPEQLAFVLAHEYTHHFMGHVSAARQNVTIGAVAGILGDVLAASQGINTEGQFTRLGATAGRLSYSPSFEQEADYVGLYILERAGFDTSTAPMFWRRMSAVNPKGLYNRTTHPTTPERFVGMQKTIQEINAKKQAGLPLLPNMLPQG